jgi:hypothetical protein
LANTDRRPLDSASGEHVASNARRRISTSARPRAVESGRARRSGRIAQVAAEHRNALDLEHRRHQISHRGTRRGRSERLAAFHRQLSPVARPTSGAIKRCFQAVFESAFATCHLVPRRAPQSSRSLRVRSIVIDGEAVICGTDGKSDFDKHAAGLHSPVPSDPVAQRHLDRHL